MSSASSRTRHDALNFLLVEDDDAHAQLLEIQFEQQAEGHHLTRVHDGAEALAYIRGKAPFEDAEPIDLVLLDLNLPGLDGHEVLERIKGDPVYGALPVVVLTTSNAPADRNKAYRLGANSYLCKPMSFDAFGEMIHALATYWGQFNQGPVIEGAG